MIISLVERNFLPILLTRNTTPDLLIKN